MNPITAAAVVKMISEAWPWAEATENAVELWADACPHLEQRTAAEAMRRLVRTLDRPPTIARFLTECRLIDRETASPFLALGSTPHSTKSESKARIGALRVFWGEATASRPDHNHHNGDENCPRCSTSGEFIAEQAPIIASILREQP